VGREKKKGRQGRKEKWKGGKGFGVFLNSFQTLFQTLQSNNKTMHSNHDAQTLIICNIIEMMFKYFLRPILFDNLIVSLEKLNLLVAYINLVMELLGYYRSMLCRMNSWESS
jgi:hypothetical protein